MKIFAGKVIFISAPYRAETHFGVLHNIEAARNMAALVWSWGGAAVCPHTNTAFMSGVCEEQRFLDGYLDILSRCDAIFYDAARISQGVQVEIERAKELGLELIEITAIGGQA